MDKLGIYKFSYLILFSGCAQVTTYIKLVIDFVTVDRHLKIQKTYNSANR